MAQESGSESKKFAHLSEEIIKTIKDPEVQNLVNRLAQRNKTSHWKDFLLLAAIFGGLALYYQHIVHESQERRADRLAWELNSKQKIMTLVITTIQEARQTREAFKQACVVGDKQGERDYDLKRILAHLSLENSAFISMIEFDDSVYGAIMDFVAEDKKTKSGCEGLSNTAHLNNLLKAEQLMADSLRQNQARLSALMN